MGELRYKPGGGLRTVGVAVALTFALTGSSCQESVGAAPEQTAAASGSGAPEVQLSTGHVVAVLGNLAVKGRAPKTGYSREQFGPAWSEEVGGCDTRNRVLQRDMADERLGEDGCKVLEGTLRSEYTGATVTFKRGRETSDDVQIDHVVSLSNAWQTGAQHLDEARRVTFANDLSNLEAVEGPVNQQKGDADAASWLPSDRSYRCTYVARQIMTKAEYGLWVTSSEREAMTRVLDACPDQALTLPA